MAEPTEGRYDTTKTVKENVDADFKRVKDAYDKDGAGAGNEKLVSETQGTALTGASAEQQRQYQEEMAKQLKAAGILPEISVAAVLKNPGDVIKGNGVDETALGRAQFNAKDPLQAAMLREFGDKYKQMKDQNQAEAGYEVPVSKAQLERTVADSKTNANERNALAAKQTEDKKNLSELVTNPKLFDRLADSKGEITKGSIAEFEKKFYAPGTEGDKFRAELGDAAAQKRAAETVEALKKTFDDPRNQDDKKGSVLTENDNWYKFGLGKGDYMTRDSLAKGLGYTKPDGSPDVEAMNKKLPTDIAVQTKPRADVPSVTDYNNTAQSRGDGPYQVAQRMLGGDQAKFFKNPDQAQAIMTDVLRQPDIWKQDKQGVPKVSAENRDAIAAAIKEREAKIAKDSGKPENNDLSSWFASRYPKLEGAPKPAEAAVQPAADYSATKLGGRGSWEISTNMVKGQNLPETARKALQDIVGNKAITGFDLTSTKAGTEIINANNVEKIREAIEKANSPQLKEWFAKRYPKKA